MLDPHALQTDELNYELDIRQQYDPPPPDATTAAQKLAYFRGVEIANGTDPITLENTFDADGREGEVVLCDRMIRGILDSIKEEYAAYEETEEPMTDFNPLASRLIHFEWRMQRMSRVRAELSDELRALIDTAFKNARLARNKLIAYVATAKAPVAGNNANHSPDAHSTMRENQNPPQQTIPPPQPPQQPSPATNGIADEHTPIASIDQTPLNVANQMRERAEREAQRNKQEIEIWLGRASDLHEDIRMEYCQFASLKRPSEAEAFLRSWQGTYTTLRQWHQITTDMVLRTQLEGMMLQMDADKYILDANCNYAQQQRRASQLTPAVRANPSTANPSAAQSTVYTHGDVYPSVRSLGGLTDGLSSGTSTDTPVMPPLTPGRRGVTFGGNQIYPAGTGSSATTTTSQDTYTVNRALTHNTQVQNVPSAQTQTSQTRNFPPLPSPHDQDSSAGSTQTYRSQYNRYYHPAVSAARFPEYGAEQRVDGDRELPQLPPVQFNLTNPCHGQQYLSRMLGPRRYDGNPVEGNKNIKLDEFLGHVKQFQLGTGASDAVVISQMATFFTGRAFTWWQTNGDSIRTLEDLKIRLKSRFENRPIDHLSLVGEFLSRKQKP